MPSRYESRTILPAFPFLSRLLDLSFQSKSLVPTTSIHAHLLRTGFSTNPTLHAKLLLSYAAAAAAATFPTNLLTTLGSSPDNPIRWNAIISAFSRQGFPSLAARAFSTMRGHGIPSNTYALCSAISASASAGDEGFGKQIHAHVCKSGFASSVFVGGALIDVYSKWRSVEDARELFDEMPVRNTVCANALLAGYSSVKLWDKGFELLGLMDGIGLEPDRFTLSAVLRMCAEAPAIRLGMQAHAHLIRGVLYLEQDVIVQSGLVEMYGKCGLVPKARLVFDMTEERRRDVVLWTSMLNAYSRNGMFSDVVATFEEMLAEGSRPDEIAFMAVISACGRIGYVAQGLEYFELMRYKYNIVPWPEHYGCVMDLLCRAGELDKAWRFANEVVCGSGSLAVSSSVWGALLTACRDCGNVEMGKVAAQRALELDPGNVGIYVELSNLYARVGVWDEIEELRELMKDMGMKKEVGCSWLELTI